MQDSPDYTPFKPKSQKQPGSPASFQLQTEYACLSEEDDNESHQGTPKTERRSKKPVDSSSLSGPFFFSVWPYFLVSQSCPILCNPVDWSLPGSSVNGHSPGKNSGVGCHTLLQGIFPTQGSPQASHILYPLSHQGSPRRMAFLTGKWTLSEALSTKSLPLDHQGVLCSLITTWTTGCCTAGVKSRGSCFRDYRICSLCFLIQFLLFL